jgi:hypothetical protein
LFALFADIRTLGEAEQIFRLMGLGRVGRRGAIGAGALGSGTSAASAIARVKLKKPAARSIS